MAKKTKKAEINKVDVEWSSVKIGGDFACVGVFSKDIQSSKFVRELNNAPVDVESLESRKAHFVNDSPFNKGFYEKTIIAESPNSYDEETLRKVKFPLLSKRELKKCFKYTFEVPFTNGGL